VMICVKVFGNFEDTYKGFIKPPKGTFLGNHAMSIVGYDDDLEQVLDGVNYKGFFLLKDSYGVNDPINKGRDEGYFYLAYDGVLKWKNGYDVDRLVFEMWTTFDTSKVKDVDYHKRNFDGSVINVKTKELKLTLGSNIAYVDGVKKTMSAIPIVKNNVTFVPVRFIAENLDARVSYDSATKSVWIYDDNQKLGIKMFIGEVEATVGNKPYKLLEAPYIANGSTMLPLRAIGEMLGKKVNFDPKTKVITIVG
ncbi:MAG: stalk domain-containing protein, partial [Sarcina sp.]